MNVSGKTLAELITPMESRIKAVRDLVTDLRPDISYNIVGISDPYGPTITDRQLSCLIVSEETRRGGQKVNEKRREKV